MCVCENLFILSTGSKRTKKRGHKRPVLLRLLSNENIFVNNLRMTPFPGPLSSKYSVTFYRRDGISIRTDKPYGTDGLDV